MELAAKAAGIEVDWRESVECLCYGGSPYNIAWNPLTNDGDALRLAVSLHIEVIPQKLWVWAARTDLSNAIREKPGNNPMAATRRAIVRAAAALGATK